MKKNSIRNIKIRSRQFLSSCSVMYTKSIYVILRMQLLKSQMHPSTRLVARPEEKGMNNRSSVNGIALIYLL